MDTKQIIRLVKFMNTNPSQEDIEFYYINHVMPYDSKHSIDEIINQYYPTFKR